MRDYPGKLERGFTEDDKKHLLEQLECLKTKKKPTEASREFGKNTRCSKPQLGVQSFAAKPGKA
jgi:hypothetical protein